MESLVVEVCRSMYDRRGGVEVRAPGTPGHRGNGQSLGSDSRPEIKQSDLFLNIGRLGQAEPFFATIPF